MTPHTLGRGYRRFFLNNEATLSTFIGLPMSAVYVPQTVTGPGLLTYYLTNSVYTFTASCTMSMLNPNLYGTDILVVGSGGGGGGNVGSGGSGGGSKFSASVILQSGNYYISVAPITPGVANGGGPLAIKNGYSSSFISASAGFNMAVCGGIAGGTAGTTSSIGYSGGGYGAASIYDNTYPEINAGSGSYSIINGTASWWGGGGGASADLAAGGPDVPTLGGPTGGADGASNSTTLGAPSGSVNTGGGGGGTWWVGEYAGNTSRGGSGIVIMSFRNS